MIVIVAGPGDRKRGGLPALSRGEESDRIDFTTVGSGRIGTAGNVVRLHVVVDERDALAHGNHQLARLGAGC